MTKLHEALNVTNIMKKVGLIVLGVVIVIAIGVGAWFLFFKNTATVTVLDENGNALFQENAQGIQVTPEIDQNGESKEIAPSGGEVTLSKTKDTTATLNLPDQSLPETQSITLNKINALANLPAGIEFVSGVEVGPDGTLLDKPANLTLALSSEQSSKQLAGFSFSADGKEFRLYPIKVENNTATFQLTSFSGYGLLVLQDDQPPLPPPSTIEMQAKQYIAKTALTAGKKGGSVGSDATKKIQNLLAGWYNASVKPNLDAAKNNDEKIDSAVHEYISWWSIVQFFGLDDAFKTEIDQSLTSIAVAITNASEKAAKTCKDQKDPTQATKLMRYSKIVQLLGLEGRTGITSDKIDAMVANCVNFELRITSNVTETSGSTVTEIDASGTGAISFQDGMKLKGNAELTVTRNQTVSMKPCTSNVPETWKLDIPEFPLATAHSGSQFSMPLDLSLPNGDGLVWECGASLRDLVDDASVTIPIPAWDFALLHDDERVGELGEQTSYLLKDWQILGKGDVFAKKVYSRSISNPFGVGPVTYHEETTLELIPKPK